MLSFRAAAADCTHRGLRAASGGRIAPFKGSVWLLAVLVQAALGLSGGCRCRCSRRPLLLRSARSLYLNFLRGACEEKNVAPGARRSMEH